MMLSDTLKRESSMKIANVFYGIALLPLVAGVALANPTSPAAKTQPATRLSQVVTPSSPAGSGKHLPRVLADAQMDNITAGATYVYTYSAYNTILKEYDISTLSGLISYVAGCAKAGASGGHC